MVLFEKLIQSYLDTRRENEHKILKILELERDLTIMKTKLHTFEDLEDKTILPILNELKKLHNTIVKLEKL